ncbi:hypothetical protein AVEN_247724-1 [Araneus ventricosus]|uniref:Uncharacterized protein n=1 Tax=Araneus ventricosus TaxID=182803 RepID=A0A4Y2PBL4_ARAVE|nr:hypothetical protein AVEN_247724-1 [Araneus ventricosus]
MDDSANASELAEKITVANAVEWKDLNLMVKCFASCDMTNSAIEKQIFLFKETKTVDGIVELLKIAEIKYDQKILECEDNLVCFDDLSDNWEEHPIENVIAQEADIKFISFFDERLLTKENECELHQMCFHQGSTKVKLNQKNWVEKQFKNAKQALDEREGTNKHELAEE